MKFRVSMGMGLMLLATACSDSSNGTKNTFSKDGGLPASVDSATGAKVDGAVVRDAGQTDVAAKQDTALTARDVPLAANFCLTTVGGNGDKICGVGCFTSLSLGGTAIQLSSTMVVQCPAGESATCTLPVGNVSLKMYPASGSTLLGQLFSGAMYTCVGSMPVAVDAGRDVAKLDTADALFSRDTQVDRATDLYQGRETGSPDLRDAPAQPDTGVDADAATFDTRSDTSD